MTAFKRFVSQHVRGNVDALIFAWRSHAFGDYSKEFIAIDEDGDLVTMYEFWEVSAELARELNMEDEQVAFVCGRYVWARENATTPIELDHIIAKIHSALRKKS